MNRTDTWEWDQYWQSPRLAACDGAGGRNYDPAIQRVWREWFARLGDGRTMVDIATGNGAVALLARDTAAARGWSWTIYGVDSANIDPARHLGEAGIDVGGIEFMGGTPAESLPFEDGSVDVVTSQYGVEYADVGAAVGEIARVLDATGVFQFVIHARDGRPVRAAGRNVDDADFLLHESRLFNAAAAFYKAVRAVESKPSPATESEDRRAMEAKAGFESELERVRRRARSSRDAETFEYVVRGVLRLHADRGRYPLEGMLGKLEAMRGAVRAHRERLAANVRSSLDAAQLAEFTAKIENAGLRVAHAGELKSEDGADRIGWLVSGAAGGAVWRSGPAPI